MERIKAGMNSFKGLKFAFILLFALIIVNIVFAGLAAFVEGKNVALATSLTLLGSIPVVLVTILGLALIGVFSVVIANKVFKCEASIDENVGLTCHAVVPFFVIGVLTNLIVLVHVLTGGAIKLALAGVLRLFVLANLIWIVVLCYFALKAASRIGFKAGAATTIISFIIAALVVGHVSLLLKYIVGFLVTTSGLL